ncbi:MAG: hypothetical protein Q4G09_04845 [Clostridia bacterium]|nr:hypothetical protein [Clostridia bacterium]
MKSNKLVKYKNNVFIKIFNFFKRFFSKRSITVSKNIIEEPITDVKNKANFLENIQIEENEEEKRLKLLQVQYDNGEIDEDDLSEEEIEKLVVLYEKETEELNADTERRKIHIGQMLKELKSS